MIKYIVNNTMKSIHDTPCHPLLKIVETKTPEEDKTSADATPKSEKVWSRISPWLTNCTTSLDPSREDYESHEIWCATFFTPSMSYSGPTIH